MRSFYVIYHGHSWILWWSIFVECGQTVKVNSIQNTINDVSDIYLDSYELIKKYNYPVEVHPVITEDGYLLNMFRIPRKGPPVLLVHGIGDTSDSWLVLGPTNSLAFLLADAGFDVWLFNARGNRYSKKNIQMITKERYWDFSFEEVGIFDMPATVDYILNETFNAQLSYIGYSQGTTAFCIMCSTKLEYNEKIKHAVLLAPVTWLTYTKYPLMNFWAQIVDKLINFSKSERIYEIGFNKKLNDYHAKVCNTSAPYSVVCELELYTNFGLRHLSDLQPNRQPVIASHIPGGVSVKTFFHYIQLYTSKRFQRYDYGSKRNMKMYSSVKPPEYNVSVVSVPVSIFVSEVDWFGDTEDVAKLKSKLQNIERFVVIDESYEFTHLEFVYGSRVTNLINNPIISILNTVSQNNY